MSGIEENYEDVEQNLKQAITQYAEDTELDVNALKGRAHHDIALRDSLAFGFAHLFTAVLGVVAKVYHSMTHPNQQGK